MANTCAASSSLPEAHDLRPANPPGPRLRQLAHTRAVFEVLAYLTLVASAILAFVTGWLTVNAAVVITVILLSSLIILSWINLGEDRHPVFLVFGTLTLF